jgi:hypothetical protein
VYPCVTAHTTRGPWAQGCAGLARFGASAGACPLSRHAGWAGRGGSTRPHPEPLRPIRGAPSPGRLGDRTTFFSRLLRIRACHPVFRPFPIGLKTFESPAHGCLTHQALGPPVLIAYLRRQRQRPHPRGLVIGARRWRQEMLEVFTLGSLQHGLNGLGAIRLPLHALYALGIKGRDDMADGLHGTAHQRRNGLGRQHTGTREDDLRSSATKGVRGAAVGLQLHTLLIGQGANKKRWFHSSSIALEAPLDKNSCGNVLGHDQATFWGITRCASR